MDDAGTPSKLWRLVDRDGNFHVLPESVTLLGREGCHIVASSRSVDLKHAIITYDHCTSCFKIKDLSSLNGTYVNDTRIPEQTYVSLSHGDHLRLGYDVTVYRVEMAACSPQAVTQYMYASVLPTGAEQGRSVESADAGWTAFPATASKPPVVAECQGCIKEQLLHHVCDDNAEDAWQAGTRCSRSSSKSPVERTCHSPMLALPGVLRPTWDRKGSPERTALSSPPWPPQGDTQHVHAAESTSRMRKSFSMPEAHGPAAVAMANVPAAASARGTPLYGQPAWWGDDAALSEAAPTGAQGSQGHPVRGGGSAGRAEDHISETKVAIGRPATLSVEQQAARPQSNGELAAGNQPRASSVSPGRTREPAMPGTAFTVNFNNSSDADQDEALSPKVGDSLSCFMPEQLRQSLRKRSKKGSKEQPQSPAIADGGTKMSISKDTSPSLAGTQVKKLGKASVTPDDSTTATNMMHHNHPAVAAVEQTSATSVKNKKGRAVPSSVAFLMGKMYDNGSEGAAIAAAAAVDGNDVVIDTCAYTTATGLQAMSLPQHQLVPASYGLRVKSEQTDDHSDDGEVSEAGTYTVEGGEIRNDLASDVCSDNELSSPCSNGNDDAMPLDETVAEHVRGQSPVIGSQGSPTRMALDITVGISSTHSDCKGSVEPDDRIYSSLNVEVGHWSALLDTDAGASEDGRSDNSSKPETVRLSRPSRRDAREPAVRISTAADRELSDCVPSSLLTSELSVEEESAAASSHQESTEAALVAAMSAGAIAARNVISPVEPDIELLLGTGGRGDDAPVRRTRREAAGELSKERLLQELGIGDAPVQAVQERPKLVQELLSSRKHHRDDDPVIVSKSKNFFEKIRPKGDMEPSGKQAAGAPKPGTAAGTSDDHHADGKHPLLHRASSDSASLRNADAAALSAAWGGINVNGHHHTSATVHGLSVASSDGFSDAASSVASRGDSVRRSDVDRQHGQSYVDKLAALSRGDPLPADSPRDGEMTARTDATARTEVLLRPTDEFVRSMSSKRSRGGHQAAKSTGDHAASPTAAYVDDDVTSGKATDPRRSGDKFGRVERLPEQQLQQPDNERFDAARPPRQPTGTAQGWRLSGVAGGADANSWGGTRGLTGESLALSLAVSRSGRSSTDSLASRGSSDGGGHGGPGAAPRVKERQQQHVRHASDSSSASVRAAVATSAVSAQAATAAAQPAPSAAAARPNRTFELRRARTLAAPDQASDRSSARSSSGTGSSVAGGSTQQRSRSGSLERGASEVSLGARIVQRSRQSTSSGTAAASGPAGAGGGGGSSSTLVTEVRGAKVSLVSKSASGTVAASSSFTRSDGGRYSMRVSSGSGSAALHAKADSTKVRQQQPGVAKKSSATAAEGGKAHGRPPAAAVAAAAASAQAKAELEREKAAWERRRSYDPRKAAAMGGAAGSSCASSVASTPRQQSLGSRASSGTASPVTPIALRQQQHQQQQQTLLLDRIGGSSTAYSPLATPGSSSRRSSAGTGAEDYSAADDDSCAVTAADYADDGSDYDGDAAALGRSQSWGEPAATSATATTEHRPGGGGSSGGILSPAATAAVVQRELQIAKMSSELAKDLELLSRGAEEEEDNVEGGNNDHNGSWYGTASSSAVADVGSTVDQGALLGRTDSSGSSSCCDEMGTGSDRGMTAALLPPPPRPRLVHTAASDHTDDSTLPDTYRAGYDEAGEAVGRPDSSSGKSAFTSYSAFTEPGLMPSGKANSPALSPVKKKVVELQSEENGGSPQIPDQNYDGVMVSSIKHISNRLSKSTSRILTRLREKVDLPSAHSSEEEAEAADRAAETLLGDHGGTGTELPGSRELAAALRTLRRAERNVRAVERALFTNDSYPEITPTVTTHERDHYLAEIKRIRDEITGFKPIASVSTSSTEEIRRVATGISSTATATATSKVLASKPAGFTTVKSLTSLKKTYY